MRTIAFLVIVLLAAAAAGDELTPRQREEFERAEAYRLWLLQTHVTEPYDAIAIAQTACGNGDFEQDIATSTEWSGAYGTVPPSGDPNFAAFTAGIVGGPLNSSAARQTWVPNASNPGNDPITGIRQVASTASTRAVRIGNSANGFGAELLQKTFTVTPANSLIGFSYAVVFEDPQHPPHQQPSFWVRVLDAGGTPITGVVDLGNGSDKAVADRANPFFQVVPGTGGAVVYRDWSCAQINLTNYVGQTVTIQFITEDCAQGAHYGYAYLDEVCGKCSTGPRFELDRDSTSCGVGQLCFNYVLPAVASTTGTVQIKVEIRQNNAVVTTLDSGVLTSGTRYCFNINPASIPGLAASLGSFEYSATASFGIATTTLAPLSTPRTTYQISCTPAGCCPGQNLIAGGDFESGTASFTSDYSLVTTGAVLPGQYALYDSAQIAAVSSLWNVQNQGSCSTTGKVLVVNGATGRPGPKRVWSQTVSVTPGAEYRFCAHFRSLPACALDVKPKIELRFSSPAGTSVSSTVNTNASNGCDWLQESRSIVIPAGVTTLTSEIWLDETGAGDGNDLAVDNISLQQMQPADPKELLVNIASSNMTATSFNVTATPVHAQTHNFTWEVCEIVPSTGACVAGTQVSNPAAWGTPGAMTFPGYNGSATLSGTAAGTFAVQKRYRITYSVFGTCTTRTFSTWYLGFSLNAMRVIVSDTPDGLAED